MPPVTEQYTEQLLAELAPAEGGQSARLFRIYWMSAFPRESKSVYSNLCFHNASNKSTSSENEGKSEEEHS